MIGGTTYAISGNNVGYTDSSTSVNMGNNSAYNSNNLNNSTVISGSNNTYIDNTPTQSEYGQYEFALDEGTFLLPNADFKEYTNATQTIMGGKSSPYIKLMKGTKFQRIDTTIVGHPNANDMKIMFWKVKILSGEYKGRIGWINQTMTKIKQG